LLLFEPGKYRIPFPLILAALSPVGLEPTFLIKPGIFPVSELDGMKLAKSSEVGLLKNQNKKVTQQNHRILNQLLYQYQYLPAESSKGLTVPLGSLKLYL
jgi:hypothetical protein